ncbi:BRO family protein [Segatella copri]|uniref:BRO family protein n=1 Tax=Segatella copri TaxID=165179 RepID=UPI001F3DD749|nr:BRO family protein [Segatella copri]
MKNLTWQNPEQLFVAQELINKVKSKCCGIKDKKKANKKEAAQVAVFENLAFGTVKTAANEKGEPWFCAKNLCDVLEYRKMNLLVNQYVNPLDALKRCIKDMVCMNCWAG